MPIFALALLATRELSGLLFLLLLLFALTGLERRP